MHRVRRLPLWFPAVVAVGVAVMAGAGAAAQPSPPARAHQLALVDRITWGATPRDVAAIAAMGEAGWLQAQLHPPPGDRLPAAVQAQIDALPLSHASTEKLVIDFTAQRQAAAAVADPDGRQAARQALKQAEAEMGAQAVTRSLWRDLYSPDQLKEQMTWFWLNHFNVLAFKDHIRPTMGDYEDQAIRPHALGRFRDLLEATLRQSAMLRYLDNDRNAVGAVNENYARELLELHTMGVGSGYTQADVEALARILTGVGVNLTGRTPNLGSAHRDLYLKTGLFEFNPDRHDFGDKLFLGHRIKGAGLPEVEQALDILSRQPATARHISRELATYFVSDDPPAALVDRMAAAFRRTDGDIAAVLQTLFASREFDASLGTRFKDPIHYVVSAVRLTVGDQVVTNPRPMHGWLRRMNEALYEHPAPDGYPLVSAAWNAPGQMAVRFEIARKIGGGAWVLFTPQGQAAPAPAETARLQQALYANLPQAPLADETRAALGQALTPQEWNTLYLSSPEFMHR